MDVAALIIAIVALILAVVVSGFGILLQWLMFKATSQQVTRMGEQNAALGERTTGVLAEIREITTHTRGTVDTTIRDVVNAALPKMFPSEGMEPTMGEQVTDVPPVSMGGVPQPWQHNRLVGRARASADFRRILRLLQSKPEGVKPAEVKSEISYRNSDVDVGEDVTERVRSSLAMFALGTLNGLGAISTTEDSNIVLETGIDVDFILAEAGES